MENIMATLSLHNVVQVRVRSIVLDLSAYRSSDLARRCTSYTFCTQERLELTVQAFGVGAEHLPVELGEMEEAKNAKKEEAVPSV